MCYDKVLRMGIVRGSIKNSCRIQKNSLVLVSLRDFEDLVNMPTAIDIITGEVIPGDNDGSRAVTFEILVTWVTLRFIVFLEWCTRLILIFVYQIVQFLRSLFLIVFLSDPGGFQFLATGHLQTWSISLLLLCFCSVVLLVVLT